MTYDSVSKKNIEIIACIAVRFYRLSIVQMHGLPFSEPRAFPTKSTLIVLSPPLLKTQFWVENPIKGLHKLHNHPLGTHVLWLVAGISTCQLPRRDEDVVIRHACSCHCCWTLWNLLTSQHDAGTQVSILLTGIMCSATSSCSVSWIRLRDKGNKSHIAII